MSIWPIDLPLPEPGEHTQTQVRGESLTLERHSPTHLDVTHGDGPVRRIGISKSATTLRFIPHPGTMPLLNFLEPRLLCPSHTMLDVVITVDLLTRMGVSDGQSFAHLLDLGNDVHSKALYGPVDTGILCRSIHTPHYASLEHCRKAHDFGEDTNESGDSTSHPLLTHLPMAMVHISIHNTTHAPLEVSKIMLPTELMGVYQQGEHIYLGKLAMNLTGPQEAELDYGGPPRVDKISPVHDLNDHPMVPARKSFLFVHSYRNKTGLDFGF